ncbi:hypothetical protein A2U01_0085517, partial [Trifolium medium]|nr:hypothetical protein [Trifolium medium]
SANKAADRLACVAHKRTDVYFEKKLPKPDIKLNAILKEDGGNSSR